MRVILDANVWISYLLATSEIQIVHQIVRVSFLERDHIQLVAPPELITELVEKIQEKPFLRQHIRPEKVEQLVEQIRHVAERPSPLAEDIPSFANDRDDDYLIVHGLSAQVDYVVTGDLRLRRLNQVEHLRLVTPLEYFGILQTEGLL
jgi:putative PIN family toxin of toxin-antitoxin system